MDAKLTLSIRPDVIVRAKKWAKAEGKSLSSAVEEYLDKITLQSQHKKSALDTIRELGAKMPKLTDAEIARRIHEHRMKQ